MYGELKGVKMSCLTHFNGHIDQDYVAAYCTDDDREEEVDINNTASHPKDHRMGAGQRVGPQVASGLRGFPSTPLELSNSALSVLLSSSARLTSSCPAPQPRVEITGRALELPSGTTAPCQKASQGSPMLRVAQPLLSCFDVYVD